MLSTQKLVVGIFHNRAQVEQAINELHQVGFDNRHIRFAKHGISTGGMLKKIKSSFGEQTIATDRIYDELVNMGVLPEDARYYESEFNAGRSIVAVLRSGVPLVATSILIRNGGYIIKGHFVQLTDHSQSTNWSADIHIRFLKGLLRLTKNMLTRYLFASEPTSVQEPKNTEAEPSSPNEHIVPSTNHNQSEETQKMRKDLINV